MHYFTRSSLSYTLTSLLLVNSKLQTINAANIVVIANLATHSHAIWFDIVTTLLARNQHNVIVLVADPEKTRIENRTTYELETSYDNGEYETDLDQMEKTWLSSGVHTWKITYDIVYDACERQMKSKGLKNFIKDVVNTNMKVDLIIKEGPASECFLALIHLLNYPPVISASPFPNIPFVNDWIGNYDNPSYVPHNLLPYSDSMTFFQRLYNVYVIIGVQMLRKFYVLPKMNELSRRTFGEHIPHVAQLETKVDLAFVNYHFILDYPKPTVPAHVSVPGLQLKPPKPLPQDIQTFLDGATDGAIIFTFGSSLKTTKMSTEYRKMFFDVFKQLKQRVIWKWETDPPPDIPNNVMLMKWLPQADILGHKNTMVFISHCGQAGVQEAIYHAVPVFAIPLLLDQYILTDKLVRKQVAIQHKYSQLNYQSVKHILDTLLDPKQEYKSRMQKLSKIFRDAPQTSAQKIIYWTNYILEHGGSDLSPASKNLNALQYYLLDVIFFVLCTPIVLFYVTKQIIRLILKQNIKPQTLRLKKGNKIISVNKKTT